MWYMQVCQIDLTENRARKSSLAWRDHKSSISDECSGCLFIFKEIEWESN